MDINFVVQVRAFHRFKREVQISANAQALWLELFGLFNEKHFPECLPISTTHLSAILDISKDGVLRAKKELIACGLVREVGERKGRQHTTYQMVWFGSSESKNDAQNHDDDCGKPVYNPVDNYEREDVCDANKDAFCDANIYARFVTHASTQIATQENVCVAHDDANCDTYTNYKQSNGKPKRSQKNACNLYFNDGWRADARARAATAQNVIDAMEDRSVIADGMNELLCRYMVYGMTPEQELDALNAQEGSALDRLNEAAFRLGVYHRAREEGRIPCAPDSIYACGGEEALAVERDRSIERVNAFRRAKLMAGISHLKPTDKVFTEVYDRFDALYGMGKGTQEIAQSLRELVMQKGA